MNRVLATKKYEHVEEVAKHLKKMESLNAEVEGKELTLEEMVDYGGRLKLILTPQLVAEGEKFMKEIKEPFALRTKYQGRLETFMKERAEAYEAQKKAKVSAQ